VAIAPPYFSSGEHIGPAAISRNNVDAYVEDTWKVNSRFTLDYGVRWELYTPISERAAEPRAFMIANGTQEYVVNPQPGYRTPWKGWEPRIQAAWQVSRQVMQRAPAARLLTIPPNIWQDNFLTGSTPFAVYAAPALRFRRAHLITDFRSRLPQLPRAYTPRA
jgi:outer membrane receptor protein involved in Fe transport